MIISSLELDFDDRRRWVDILNDISKMLGGEARRSLLNPSIEFSYGAEFRSAPVADYHATVIRFIGVDDLPTVATRA